jgi:cytochrome P450
MPPLRTATSAARAVGPHYCVGAVLARLETAVASTLPPARFPGPATGDEPIGRTGAGPCGFDALPVNVA